MTNETIIDYLAECRRQIEARLNWGDSALWTSRDFEQLSEKIREATDVYLSIATLKRVWGKVKYDSLPATTTMDTLARFAGHDSFRSLKHSIAMAPVTNSAQTIPAAEPSAAKPRYFWIWPVAVLALAIIIVSFYFTGKKAMPPIIDATRYQFTSKKVLTEGVPNSVVFNYDATAAPYDSVYIQQSWDPARRTKVPRQQQQYTSVYYYPGVFKAKLVIGNQIVKQHDLLIKTKGWLPIIEHKPTPVYFEELQAIPPDGLGLSPQQITDKNISLQPVAPWVRYTNIGNWGNLQTDSFRLDADVKNDYREGSAICAHTEVRVLCEDAAIIIPLCDKGCISELNMLVLDQSIPGKVRDLSFLGVDFHNWIHVTCIAANGQFRLLLDSKQVFQVPLPSKPYKVEGIDFRFQGTGRIRNVTLQ